MNIKEILKNSYIQAIMGILTAPIIVFILIFKFKMSVSSVKLAVIFILTIVLVTIFLIKYFKMPKNKRSFKAAFTTLLEEDKNNN